MTQSLLSGKAAVAAALLQQLAERPDAAWMLPFIHAIVSGSRDRRLAEAPDMRYTMAAELPILIETLEQAAASPA